MPEITVGQAALALELGISQFYKETLEATEETWQAWLESKPIERYTDYEALASGVGPVAEKPPGSPFQTDTIYLSARKGYTVKPYGIALVLQHEVVKWEWYGIYKPLGRSLARAARNRYEVDAYAIFNRAFDTSDSVYTDYRGDALCATSHTRLDGGTWSNRPTTDVTLSMDGLEVGWKELRKLRTHRGFYQNAKPVKLVVPVELFWLAQTYTKSQYDPENAHMAYNNAKALGLDITPDKGALHITDTHFWFLLTDKSMYKLRLGTGESPDLKTAVIPANRSIMYTSYCSFRIECFEAMGVWGSRGQ